MKTKRPTSNWVLTAALLGTAALAAHKLVRPAAFDFRGKTIVVTGGSRGLGFLLARELLHERARVAICARNSAELERARTRLVNGPAQLLAIPCDLGSEEQARAMVAEVTQTFGPIDVLINNAGVIQVGPMAEMNVQDFQEALNSNFWSAVYTTLAVLPEMRQQRSGRIVNIASIGGRLSVPHLLPYCCSKFALAGFSQGLRTELARDDIIVTTIFPGLMRTGSPRNALFKGKHGAEFAWFSISDALPITSMNAERAARQFIAACRRGDAKLVLGIQAQMAERLHAFFPGTTQHLLELVNRLLPAPGGIGKGKVRGDESTSALAPSFLTFLNERAGQRSNQVG
jgi:NAD(P)-dependent dehydrogenase (short-subunit alcohol dehydrogenase family)